MELYLKRKNFKPLCTFIGGINDDSKLVSDADQHPKAHLAGNYYSFARICEESKIFYGHLWIYLTVTQSKIDELARNVDKNVIWNNLYTFPFKTQN